MPKAPKVSAAFHPSVKFISAPGTILAAGFGGWMASRGRLRISDIVAFPLYLSLFYTPVTGLANLLEDMQPSLAGAERVLDSRTRLRPSWTSPAPSPLQT